MYNRYIPRDTPYEPIPEPTRPSSARRETRRPPPPSNPLDGLTGKLGGLLKRFHLDDLDSGDILLLLILILLFLDSDDDLELLLTLGLLILFGLFGKEEDSSPGKP